MKSYRESRAFAFFALFAVICLAQPAIAEETIDVSNAGIAKAKRESREYLAASKPSEPLVVPDTLIRSLFEKTYSIKVPATPLQPVVTTGNFSIKGGVAHPFQFANELRRTMLNVSETPDDKDVFDIWHNQKLPQFLAKLTAPFPVQAPIVAQKFLDDWDTEVMKVVSSQQDEKAKAVKYKLAFRQAAYQITAAFNEAFGEQVEFVKSLSTTVPRGNVSAAEFLDSDTENGMHHYDVVHERLMNGIYRRHDRRFNKIERITARR